MKARSTVSCASPTTTPTPAIPSTSPRPRRRVMRSSPTAAPTRALKSGVAALMIAASEASRRFSASAISVNGAAALTAPSRKYLRHGARGRASLPAGMSSTASVAAASSSRQSATATAPRSSTDTRMNRNDAPQTAASASSIWVWRAVTPPDTRAASRTPGRAVPPATRRLRDGTVTAMNPETTPLKSRTGFLVGGVVSAVAAVGLIVGGGALVWADHEKDSDGYLMTGKHRFTAQTAALHTENMDINLDGADWLVSEPLVGKVRVKVDQESSKPVFVGIAKTDDVERYLKGVSSTTVTDVDYSPFKASYDDHAGARRATPPAQSRIWAASATGDGRQTVNWEMKDGDWSVVVMNADGSPGVAADISAGASLPV